MSQQDAFDEGTQLATNNHLSAIEALKTFNPKDNFKNYTNSPSESDYVTNPVQFENDKKQKLDQDATARVITSGIEERGQRPNYSKNPNTGEINDVYMKSSGIEQPDNLYGDYHQAKKSDDVDFNHAVSVMETTNEAAKNLNADNLLFIGERKTCSKTALGYLDCCVDGGWGKDIHLAKCSQEEKDLGKAKENAQTVYLGEYCKRNRVGFCIEHRKAYCVFPSKLARIVQVQGRYDQLHISFGSPEHADCRGLTVSQFASIDLGKLNFDEYAVDIAKKLRLEDRENIQNRIDESARFQILKKNIHA